MEYALQDEASVPFRGLTTFKDLETGQRMEVLPDAIRAEYREVFAEFVDTFKRGCAEARIEYVAADTSVAYETLLASFLTKRARMG